MAGFAVECLRKAGLEPTVAWYRPFTEDAGLSAAILRPGRARVGSRNIEAFGGAEAWEIGAFLPELEFNQNRASAPWRRLIDRADSLVSVSGSCLAAQPFLEVGRSFLAWVATPWREDRSEREKSFPALRRLIDAALVRPVMQRLERNIVVSGSILPLSAYTRDRLRVATGVSLSERVLPMPVDSNRFAPARGAVSPGLVGFVGRLDDPRKRIDLLISALGICLKRGVLVEALLVGGVASTALLSMIEGAGLGGRVRVLASLPNSEIHSLLRSIDVFVIPSEQEGLCIAGLEAMASGCPVVSTRCGGPEEYVIDGETGVLVPHDPEAMAEAVARIVCDRSLREKLAAGARSLAVSRYSQKNACRTFLEALEDSTKWRN